MGGRQDQKPDFWKEAAGQGTAALNGAGDALTLGLGKPVGAGLGAAFGFANGGSFEDRYKAIRQRQDARQHYEEQHYPVARDIGLGAGTLAAVLASDGLAEFPNAARLAPQAIREIGSPVSHLEQYARLGGSAAGVGAGTGLLGQATVDLAQGWTPRASELAGAAAGGAAAGPALFFKGPGTASAVEATVNHGVQSALRGEPMPWDKVQQDTTFGAVLGLGVGALAESHVQNLSKKPKGDLGEALSRIKSGLLSDRVIKPQMPIELDGGRKTIADLGLEPTAEGLKKGTEAKMGYGAGFSPPQKQALRDLGPAGRYYVDHFVPADVARGVGGAAAIAGAQASSSSENPDAGSSDSDPDDLD